MIIFIELIIRNKWPSKVIEQGAKLFINCIKMIGARVPFEPLRPHIAILPRAPL